MAPSPCCPNPLKTTTQKSPDYEIWAFPSSRFIFIQQKEAAFGDFTVSVRQELTLSIITGHMSNTWRILLTGLLEAKQGILMSLSV